MEEYDHESLGSLLARGWIVSSGMDAVDLWDHAVCGLDVLRWPQHRCPAFKGREPPRLG